jgi:hypothetical protein
MRHVLVHGDGKRGEALQILSRKHLQEKLRNDEDREATVRTVTEPPLPGSRKNSRLSR